MSIQVETISQQLTKYLNEEILDSPVQIDPETPFSEMGIESYDIIQLVLFIERKFGVELPESDLIPEHLNSISSLANCTTKYL
jgi:acyl carrier protein